MSDPIRPIGFEQLGIGEVLSRHQLKVPPNQRDYSWKEREVTGLFHDLSRAVSENASDYFLGSIVSIPRAIPVLEIVDGQQRLATTAILYAAIRNALHGRPSDKLIVEHVENSFLTTIDTKMRERIPRLQLNVTDSDYFRRRIVHNEVDVPRTARSHDLIHNAANYAATHVDQLLKGFKDNDFGDVLNRWSDFLEHRAMVILLKVPSDINAYTMFETLNDRGLRTSQVDLVKNYLFGQSGDRVMEAQHKWAVMKAHIETIDDDDDITILFLRQALISLFGHITKNEVYQTVQKNARGASAAIQFLSRLERIASDYTAILNADHEKWNRYLGGTRRSMKVLILLRATPMRPLLLSIAREFDEKDTDAALRLLVRVAVRFLIVGGMRSGSVEEGLAEAAKKVSEGTVDTTKKLLNVLDDIIPTDLEFRDKFAQAAVSKEYLGRYYLRSLEQFVSETPDPYFEPVDDSSIVNLEHVLPLNPDKNWPQFSQDQADTLHNRLGNLVLMLARNNSRAGNAPFSEKKLAYATTAYELTRQIADLPDWTPEAIALRQNKMAELAVKTWPI